MVNIRGVQTVQFLEIGALLALSPQQQMSNLERNRAQTILQIVSSEVKNHYYDPKFHGIDWDAKVAEAKEKIEKETSFNMAMAHIAAAMDTLDDSHTFLIPPQHAYRHDYGFQYQIVGEKCFVIRVEPGSDAEAKGIKAGDQLLSMNGYDVNRSDLWRVQYVFSILRPQLQLQLEIQDPSGTRRRIDVQARIQETRKVSDLSQASDVWDLVREEAFQEFRLRARFQNYGNDLLVVMLPRFVFPAAEAEYIAERANRYPSLILDLRSNPGGAVDSLKYLISAVFERKVRIADRMERKGRKPEIAKGEHHAFQGKLVVLVDARSASAAELFARIVQLEKRGVVIGDHTSGKVMEAKRYDEQLGKDTAIFFGISITESDLIMPDGKSLEHAGVTPDETVLPTAQDLALGRDPVLAHAAELLGVKLSPEDAGKAFPYEQIPE
jgi:carboxyl-terminal processing protease